MKKIYSFCLLAFLLLIGSGNAWGETLTFDFEDTGAHRTSGNNSYGNNSYSENDYNISCSYMDVVTSGTPLNGRANATGRVAKNTTNSPVLILGPINLSDATITNISYYTKGVSAMAQTLSFSLDNETWTSLKSIASVPTSSTQETASTLSISGSSTFYIKIATSVSSSTSSNRDVQIDDIVITYSIPIPSATPTINGETSFSGSQTITITAAEGASIYYTIDGSTPTTSSTLYSGAFSIDHSCTVKAVALEVGKVLSAVASKSFTNTALGSPVFSLAAGTYVGTQSVEISCDNADMILYTTDGSTPSYEPLNGDEYNGAISVSTNTTIKAIGLDNSANESSVATATYNIKVATPTITIPSGPFVSTKNVTIACATDGASISYSTDDGESWNLYSEPFAISATSIIKAKATKANLTDSDEASETFTKETVYNGLAAFGAAVTNSSANYFVNLTNAQMTYVNNSNGYLSEEEAGAIYYNSSAKPTLKRTYNGVYQVTALLYNSMPEITAITEISGESTTTNPTTVKEPRTVELATFLEHPENYYGQQLRLVGVTIPSTTELVEDGMTIQSSYNNSLGLVEGNTYTFVGYPMEYWFFKCFPPN